MTGTFGLGYLIWIALVAVAAIALRRWYSVSQDRSQLVFWVILFLICPPLAIVAYLMLKLLRITKTLRTENSSHG